MITVVEIAKSGAQTASNMDGAEGLIEVKIGSPWETRHLVLCSSSRVA